MKKLSGVVTGTEETINVDCGFKPDVVRVINTTTRNGIDFNANDDVNVNGVTRPADGGAVAKAASAAAGLAQYDGVTGVTPEGFTIGASAAVNVDGNTLLWEAEQLD